MDILRLFKVLLKRLSGSRREEAKDCSKKTWEEILESLRPGVQVPAWWSLWEVFRAVLLI